MTCSAVTAQRFKYADDLFNFHKTFAIAKAVICDDRLDFLQRLIAF